MEFWQAIRSRHSVRAFASEREVSPELVMGLLGAAIEAPSANNLQSWHFVVVRRAAVRGQLAHAAHDQMFLVDAPVIIVVCADVERAAQRYRERGRNLYAYQETAAATQNLLLAATDLGLGACWVGAFDEKEVGRVLGLRRGLIPVTLVPIGYPAAPGERETTRRPVDEVTTYVE